MSFRPIKYSEAYVGAAIKKSKKRVIWEFGLDDLVHSLLLDCSYVTSKRKVAFDGSLLYKGTKGLRKEFSYSFALLGHSFRVIEGKHSLDLYIDNISYKQVHANPPRTLPTPRIYEDWAPEPLAPPKTKPEESKSLPRLSADFLELDEKTSQIFSPSKVVKRDIFAAPKVQMRVNTQDADLLNL
mmetsp:Transcript_4922/g.9217  ORF Transcript_4922/g.9217 Transcript_4922/m.9217 type:complete len:184 (+) Transcript_4922:951-1502(+)